MTAMIAACLWLVNYKDRQASEESSETTEDSTTLLSLETDTIQSIYFKNESTEMTLNRTEDDNWEKSDDNSFPVNQTNANNMMNAFADLSASSTITEDADNLADFGLDNPVIQISVTAEDGKTTKIALGAEAPVAGGYYTVLNDGKEVYIVEAAFFSKFNYNLTEMTAVETIPAVTAENITHLTVENKDKPGFEIVYDEDNPADFAGLTNWTMKQPYETPVPADADAVSTLLANYSGMSFLSCVDYDAGDLGIYGLEEPAATVSLEYFEEYTKDTDNSAEGDTNSETDESIATAEEDEVLKTKLYYSYELIIGTTDEDGNYYAKSKDSNAVNTMSADAVAQLIDIDAYSNVNHYINLINLDSINRLEVNFGGETYTMTMEKTEAAADDTATQDAESESTKYYFDDKEVEEDNFKELYQLIISPTTEREIPEEYFENNTEQTPYLTLTFHFTDTEDTATIQYKPYDESFYVANINGVEYFLTDLRKVNEIAETVKNFQS